MTALAQTEPGTPALRPTGSASTDLDATVSGLPWGDAFDYRKGVDAVTGSLMPSALEPATPVERTVKSSSEHFRFVQTESELETEIEAAVSGKYNIEGVTASASAEYLQKVKFSELSLTLIASYRSEYEGYDELQSPQLTAQAKELIGDPAKFRHQYGDYFVTGGKRGSEFNAVYVCQAHSASDMSQFKASVGAETPDVFSADGSTKFMRAASEHSISVSVDLWMNGYEGSPPGGPWTPEKILEALNWFKQHERGVRVRAELAHYSALDPKYPRTIDVAPDVFVALRKLYTTVWNVRSLYGSCPPNYQKQFTEAYGDLVEGVTASQSQLATDFDLRVAYQKKAENLRAALGRVFERMDFYFMVRSVVGTEPAQGHENEDSSRQSYLYGYTTYTKGDAVTINTDRDHYADKWQIGWREHTFDWEHGDRLIVGWEVVSNWHDGTNGFWRKDIGSILLGHRAEVYVKSFYDRGCDWSFNVSWVDAKDYDF